MECRSRKDRPILRNEAGKYQSHERGEHPYYEQSNQKTRRISLACPECEAQRAYGPD
jgi:hypothetical protein